jgi:hypothetical protein
MGDGAPICRRSGAVVSASAETRQQSRKPVGDVVEAIQMTRWSTSSLEILDALKPLSSQRLS